MLNTLKKHRTHTTPTITTIGSELGVCLFDVLNWTVTYGPTMQQEFNNFLWKTRSDGSLFKVPWMVISVIKHCSQISLVFYRMTQYNQPPTWSYQSRINWQWRNDTVLPIYETQIRNRKIGRFCCGYYIAVSFFDKETMKPSSVAVQLYNR